MDFPTNFTPEPDGTLPATCIDLISRDKDSLVASVKPVGQLGASHHSILETEIIVPSKSLGINELVHDYSKADFKRMREMITSLIGKNPLISLMRRKVGNYLSVKLRKLLKAAFQRS